MLLMKYRVPECKRTLVRHKIRSAQWKERTMVSLIKKVAIICAISTLSTQSRADESGEFVKSADHVSFYRQLSIQCGWTKTPHLDAVDEMLARVKPKEYVSGRNNAERTMGELTKAAQGNPKVICSPTRPIFEKIEREIEELYTSFKSNGWVN